MVITIEFVKTVSFIISIIDKNVFLKSIHLFKFFIHLILFIFEFIIINLFFNFVFKCYVNYQYYLLTFEFIKETASLNLLNWKMFNLSQINMVMKFTIE